MTLLLAAAAIVALEHRLAAEGCRTDAKVRRPVIIEPQLL
jgi:hypothetical protein